MRISELIDPLLWQIAEVGPTRDEVRAIEDDKRVKKSRHKTRGLVYVDMPGNDATYPAL